MSKKRIFVARKLKRMKKVVTFLMILVSMTAMAQTRLDSIAGVLKDAPVQEKVYLHLDNTCYYKGDTIWYKSYVVRADNLDYTDMSRIVYVELVSPDGLVVERQSLIVSPDGHGDGNFALRDSLYSGYYELRAYTRWMLNFCVTEHPYDRKDREQFYNRQMAHDFFRQFGTIYSRVVPVYERPDSTGDYLQKYIVSRPKTRMEKELKERLSVNFYPEGGHLIAGTRCNVAFEALTEEGEWVDIQGTLQVGNKKTPISTLYQGRGVFSLDVPDNDDVKVRFNYHDKDYIFSLPKSEQMGCALQVNTQGDAITAQVAFRGLSGSAYGMAVLCRGVLKHFQKLTGGGTYRIDTSNIPTGVCDLLIVDENGQPLADRLFFVNHHDYNLQPITVSGVEDNYQPFAPITLQFQAPAEAKHISISVRDGSTDDPTYDTGNIMTDLLLSSDLQGFIAYPDYYFEADDTDHRQALDLLMMVQGWRRYDYNEITADVPLRYQPEQTMSVEGAVYKTIDFDDIRECEVGYWLTGIFGYCDSDEETADSMGLRSLIEEEMEAEAASANGSAEVEEVGTVEQTANPQSARDPFFGDDNRPLPYEVMLNGELVLGENIANIDMETTNGGRFSFNVPPFYGDGILFLSAHKIGINEEKHRKWELKGMINEDEWPDFYVKRDLFYPIFARKYNYYQCHLPDERVDFSGDYSKLLTDTTRLSKFDAQLQEVEVKGHRRRGRHSIDYTKPAYVYDAYELYNLATDYGLSFGKLNFRRFPIQVSMLLVGNYNKHRSFNVEARMSDNQQVPYTFYRTFKPDETVETTAFRSGSNVASNLRLNRQKEIRLFTDFELRNEEKPQEQSVSLADVTLDFVLMPDHTKRYTYRDRRIVLHGMYFPDSFYHPDYSKTRLPQSDRRRTLYWNPNANLDADGRFTATFYNNGHNTRIRVSTAGVFPRH